MKRILNVVAAVVGIIVVINAPAILSWIGAGLLSLIGTILSWIGSLIGAVLSWIGSLIGAVLSGIGAALLSLIAAILTPILPILIVIGSWVAIFAFFALVTSGPKTPETTEDKILKELEKLNRKSGW